jgi:hypothetical protein
MKTNSPALLLTGDVLASFSPTEINAYPRLAFIKGRLTEVKERSTDNG